MLHKEEDKIIARIVHECEETGIKAVYVDMDGTLIMSEERNRYVIESIAERYGVPSDKEHWNENIWPVCAGQPEPTIHGHLTAVFEETTLHHISPEEFMSLCHDGYEEHIEQIAFRPYFPELLVALKNEGIMLALVTSSTKKSVKDNFNQLVKHGDIFDLAIFDTIVAKDDVKGFDGLKPKPFPYELAARRMGFTVKDMLRGHMAFEDSPTGLHSSLLAFASDPHNRNKVFRFVDETTPSGETDNRHVEISCPLDIANHIAPQTLRVVAGMDTRVRVRANKL